MQDEADVFVLLFIFNYSDLFTRTNYHDNMRYYDFTMSFAYFGHINDFNYL